MMDDTRIWVIYSSEWRLLEVGDGGLGEVEARRVFVGVVRGMIAGHDVGVVHGGLGVGSVVVGDCGGVGVIGWGVDGGLYEGGRRREECMCPEVLGGGACGGFEGDLWGLGVLLFWLFCGRGPWKGGDRWGLWKGVCGGEWGVVEEVEVGREGWRLVGRLLRRVKEERVGLGEVLKDGWVVGNGDRVEGERRERGVGRVGGVFGSAQRGIKRDISLLSASSCSDEAIVSRGGGSKRGKSGMVGNRSSNDDDIDVVEVPAPPKTFVEEMKGDASEKVVESDNGNMEMEQIKPKKSRGFLRRKRRLLSRNWSFMSLGASSNASTLTITHDPSSSSSTPPSLSTRASSRKMSRARSMFHRNRTHLDLSLPKKGKGKQGKGKQGKQQQQQQLETFIRETLSKKTSEKSIVSVIAGLNALGVDTTDDLVFLANTMKSAREMTRWLGRRTSLPRSARSRISKRLIKN